MKKISLFYLTACLFIGTINLQAGTYADSNEQSAKAVFYDLDMNYAAAVSPNGRWIVGSTSVLDGIDYINSGFIFDIQSETLTVIPESEDAKNVNDKGQVVGLFVDRNYPRDLSVGRNGYLLNSGVYCDGKWYSLGLGRYKPLSDTDPTNASVGWAIDAAGNVYGSNYIDAGHVIPFAWKYNTALDNYTTDTLAYTTTYSGRIHRVSSDGSLAGGWIIEKQLSQWTPAYWISPTICKTIPSDRPTSQVSAVSSNGKYIAGSQYNHAFFYDVESDTIIVLETGITPASITGVSDNGLAVGRAYRGAVLEFGTEAFVWSRKTGLIWMRDFLDNYCSGIEIPDDDFFRFPRNVSPDILDMPTGISADGLTIVGWSGYGKGSQRGWIIKLPALELVESPHNLIATVKLDANKKVALAWEAPTDFGGHSLDYYKIYRNDEFLAKIPVTETAYVDSTVAEGSYYTYAVSALFDYKNEGQYIETGVAKAVEVLIANSDLPYFDIFNYGTFDGFKKHFWDSQSDASNQWMVYGNTGYDLATPVALFLGAGNRSAYNLSLTSKPLDATEKNKVVLSFVYRVLTAEGNPPLVGIKDTIAIEIGIDGVWTRLKHILINNRYSWTPETADISGLVAGKFFNVRFRCISGDNRNEYNFVLDHVGVALENTPVPTGVKAVKYTDENKVRLYYKDAKGSYGFSYFNGRLVKTAGNGGKPFIAAEKLEPKDLKPMADKYLTSITACINSEYQGVSDNTRLRLAVFVNGQRVDSTAIASYIDNDWNNFKLSNPIRIIGDETLHAGIEVLEHPSDALPMEMDDSNTPSHANSKLVSYDGGKTWSNVANEKVEGINGAWAIIANFRDENYALPEDDELMDLAYNIYRNGTQIATLRYGQVFEDTGFSSSDYYQVAEYRLLGGLSELSERVSIDVITSLNVPQVAQFGVYPNPARSHIYVNIDFEELTVYDAQGQMIAKTKERKIDVRGFAEGLYFIDAILKDGSRAVAKVMVDKN
ncbi:MAG: T9SS type A sorting domain-containing protein [Dysgonamonadaceae bacterium]|jgi:hypothetical protein|nr:T9SS type A sorting domain-containing protein [Dysgonamonadaceae bacterium]